MTIVLEGSDFVFYGGRTGPVYGSISRKRCFPDE
jgi:hypothetical protein